jgi:peptide subunit release factor 1 (eRF1)
MGQVDELVITAVPEVLAKDKGAAKNPAELSQGESTADELVVLARNTSAKIRFIEDKALLEPVGGVGAFLRFKL